MAPKISVAYVPLTHHPAKRITQLLAGLLLYGISTAMTIRASLGLNPWSVLNEGVERHVPLSFGMVSALIGALVLLLWIPLRQLPRLGTVANILVLAVAFDVGLWLIPADGGWAWRVVLLVAGIVLNGLSIAVYVGARLGPGPRDGLMTGAAARSGRSIRLTRTVIELTVLVVGWVLGGTVGVGTVAYALGIGPVTQLFMARFTYRPAGESREDRTARNGGEAAGVGR
ncbi:hypothetical protein AB0I28_04345 [Phytomonospora sp. NPDC050363]|uniref:membrane protein YczE n=1 Tax=Phytomonospora sp. NPDC050363 TaxID=3155642 RepID=UPI00340E357C